MYVCCNKPARSKTFYDRLMSKVTREVVRFRLPFSREGLERPTNKRTRETNGDGSRRDASRSRDVPRVLAPLITAGLGGISRLQFLMQMERQISEASGRKCWYRHNEAIFFRVALRVLSSSPGLAPPPACNSYLLHLSGFIAAITPETRFIDKRWILRPGVVAVLPRISRISISKRYFSLFFFFIVLTFSAGIFHRVSSVSVQFK